MFVGLFRTRLGRLQLTSSTEPRRLKISRPNRRSLPYLAYCHGTPGQLVWQAAERDEQHRVAAVAAPQAADKTEKRDRIYMPQIDSGGLIRGVRIPFPPHFHALCASEKWEQRQSLAQLAGSAILGRGAQLIGRKEQWSLQQLPARSEQSEHAIAAGVNNTSCNNLLELIRLALLISILSFPQVHACDHCCTGEKASKGSVSVIRSNYPGREACDENYQGPATGQ
jgi:hypothetical protein